MPRSKDARRVTLIDESRKLTEAEQQAILSHYCPTPAPRISVEEDTHRWTVRSLFSSGAAYEMNCRIQKSTAEDEMERARRQR